MLFLRKLLIIVRNNISLSSQWVLFLTLVACKVDILAIICDVLGAICKDLSCQMLKLPNVKVCAIKFKNMNDINLVSHS